MDHEKQASEDGRVDPAAFPPIEVARAADVVTRSLIDAIRSGSIAAGEKLPRDQVLAERLGVSRAVIRESFDRLRHAGLIEVRRGHAGGATVRSVAIPVDLLTERRSLAGADLERILQARRAIESMTAPLAALAATDAELDGLEEVVSGMEASRPDPLHFAELDVHFHLRIATASGNPQLESFLRPVFRELAAVRSEFPGRYGSMDGAEAAHRATLDALRSRDPAIALGDIREHLATLERNLIGRSLGY
jgi:GntR family transcriptional regulator, transcriptional repressor for pyruvate dehydrogenase complex